MLRNLRFARINLEAGLYKEACFGSRQAAEKALKALLEAQGVVRRGYALVFLTRVAKEIGVNVPSDIRQCLAFLDKQYIPTRYPDAYTEDAPVTSTRRGMQECLACAEKVARWVGLCEKYSRAKPKLVLLFGSRARGDYAKIAT